MSEERFMNSAALMAQARCGGTPMPEEGEDQPTPSRTVHWKIILVGVLALVLLVVLIPLWSQRF
jgi:uncharacterized integral membrane protein